MGKSVRKTKGRKILLALAVILFLLFAGVGMMFQEELKIAGSVRPVMAGKKVYYMESESDYHFEEFLAEGWASSDQEVSAEEGGTQGRGTGGTVRERRL